MSRNGLITRGILVTVAIAAALCLVLVALAMSEGARPASAQAGDGTRLQGTIDYSYTWTTDFQSAQGESTQAETSMSGKIYLSLKRGTIMSPVGPISTWVDDGTSKYITATASSHDVKSVDLGTDGISTCTMDTAASLSDVNLSQWLANTNESWRDSTGISPMSAFDPTRYPNYYPNSGATKAYIDLVPDFVNQTRDPYQMTATYAATGIYLGPSSFDKCGLQPNMTLIPPDEVALTNRGFIGSITYPGGSTAPTVDLSRDYDSGVVATPGGTMHDHLTVSGVLSPKELAVTADTSPACQNQDVTFKTDPVTDANWSGGGTPSSGTGTTFLTRFATPGNHTVTATPGSGSSASATVPVWEDSGTSWVPRFPGSTSTADLVEPFRTNTERFLAALRAAGANVTISATYRPPERAYLMHYAWMISKNGLDPATVPPMAGVDVCWLHRTATGAPSLKDSRSAASDMVRAYQLKFQPVLTSRHTEGRAIDMTITWGGTLNITDATGKVVSIGKPRNGADNTTLWNVGASYGVIKLPTDPPHWSDDGQ